MQLIDFRTLRVISDAPNLRLGRYKVERATAEHCGGLLREAIDANRCESQIRFGSTARILSQLCGRRLDADAKPVESIFGPESDELLMQIRLNPQSTKEQRRAGIGVVDLDFYLITRE